MKAVAMMYILRYDEKRAMERRLAGGKGASLASMKRAGFPVPLLFKAISNYWRNDPSILDDYERRMWDFNAQLERRLDALSGAPLIDAILTDQPRLMELLMEPTALCAMMVGMLMGERIDKIGAKLAGERHVSSALNKSVDHNVNDCAVSQSRCPGSACRAAWSQGGRA